MFHIPFHNVQSVHIVQYVSSLILNYDFACCVWYIVENAANSIFFMNIFPCELRWWFPVKTNKTSCIQFTEPKLCPFSFNLGKLVFNLFISRSFIKQFDYSSAHQPTFNQSSLIDICWVEFFFIISHEIFFSIFDRKFNNRIIFVIKTHS